MSLDQLTDDELAALAPPSDSGRRWSTEALEALAILEERHHRMSWFDFTTVCIHSYLLFFSLPYFLFGLLVMHFAYF